ncbi:MAG TPA: hypothetical protein VMD08_18275 [Candidatus Baltobacteraceae bacterium]|nr:hypothetical protein [Candidatus Baltobacteraceae bacterium]
MTAPLGSVSANGWATLGQSGLRVERPEDQTLLRLAGLSFESAVAEALAAAAEARTAAGADPAASALAPEESAIPSAPASAETAPNLPGREASVIRREADRTGIDAQFLVALRRTENGGPGREFGVLSVKAPDLDSQARVAANSVRHSVQRFEQTGGQAIDPQTGQYTEAFLRYFSARYAPVGANNDPSGLNRYHAANLIALYQKTGRRSGDG